MLIHHQRELLTPVLGRKPMTRSTSGILRHLPVRCFYRNFLRHEKESEFRPRVSHLKLCERSLFLSFETEFHTINRQYNEVLSWSCVPNVLTMRVELSILLLELTVRWCEMMRLMITRKNHLNAGFIAEFHAADVDDDLLGRLRIFLVFFTCETKQKCFSKAEQIFLRPLSSTLNW